MLVFKPLLWYVQYTLLHLDKMELLPMQGTPVKRLPVAHINERERSTQGYQCKDVSYSESCYQEYRLVHM